jgi:hypothetical protein
MRAAHAVWGTSSDAVPEVNLFRGVDVNVPWTWSIAFVVLVVVAIVLWVSRHSALDDRAYRRYVAASVLSAVLALIAFGSAFVQLFSSFPAGGASGFAVVLVAILLITYANRTGAR